MFSMLQVVLIGIGFTLEGDIQISPSIASILNDSNEPFDKIHDIEWHIKPFFYLCGVNLLVIESYSVARPFGKEYAKQIESVETFTKGNNFVVYYFHKVYFGIQKSKEKLFKNLSSLPKIVFLYALSSASLSSSFSFISASYFNCAS